MSKNILIVEDDPVLQDALKIALSKESFRVCQVFDGRDVFSVIKKEKPDLIIMDLLLPGMDGYHLLYEMNRKNLTKKIPVVVLSVVDTPSSNEECGASGIADYMVKSDYSIQNIVKKVKSLIKL